MDWLTYTEPLIWVLVVIGVFFPDDTKRAAVKAILGRFGFTMNGTPVEKKMDTLTEHYNHDTTHLLGEILTEARAIKTEQQDVNKKTTSILTKLDEILKYGVKELK